MRHSETQPFSVFGKALKAVRIHCKESSAEVCGAVEITPDQLEAYEKGEKRPSEDILQLLIQHFKLQDTQADEWWKLAGYDRKSDPQYFVNDDFGMPKETHTIIVDPEDARIVYTDMVQVMVNNYGVIMNFMQGAGPNNHPLAVARVGMSKEHARSIVELLKTTLDQSIAENSDADKPIQQKSLPSPKRDNEQR